MQKSDTGQDDVSRSST